MIQSIECLPFFLVTIKLGTLFPKSLSYSWRMHFLCLAPVTMILSLPSYAKGDWFVSVGIRAKAALVCSKEAVARTCWGTIVGDLVVIEVCFFITRFLCSLLLMSCSNKKIGQSNFGGKLGTWPDNQTKYHAIKRANQRGK